MGPLSLLHENPLLFLGLAALLLFSVIAHELAHGWVAYLFGDDTAREMGRLSLNPLAHLDILGTVMLFIVGFGWAKPVPVDFSRLHPHRAGLFCVALAGCAVNILIAGLSVLCFVISYTSHHALLMRVFGTLAHINVILASFNLIPIPPLDGSKVLASFLPAGAQRKMFAIERWGFPVLLILLLSGVLDPAIRAIEGVIYSFIAMFFPG